MQPAASAYRENSAIAVSVVVPVFNSVETLPALVDRLFEVLNKLGRPFEIICVNDGSPDQSWQTLLNLRQRLDGRLRAIDLVRNVGQHQALICGLFLARGRYVITIDDDLQNPPEEIPKLLSGFEQGADLVIAAYDSKEHPRVRNFFGSAIDGVLRRIFQLPADFQLTSFRAIESGLVQRVLSLRGGYPYLTAMLLSQTGSPRNVTVRHQPRPVGRSNYSFRKSVSLALNLILSYSRYPLYLVLGCCLFSFVFSVGFGVYITGMAFWGESPIRGWASTMVLISFFSGLILLALFVFGIYLARILRAVSGVNLGPAIREQA